MDNKERKVLEEAGLLYPTPNCVEYYQIVKATADEVAQRIFEAMSDYVQVVRCKNCTYYQEGFRGEHWCTKHSSAYSIMQWGVKEDDYCSWAERREDANTN